MIQQQPSQNQQRYVVCLQNEQYPVDLIVGKIYRVLRPEPNDPPSELRLIDESGEDYLYPSEWFETVEIHERAKAVLGANQSQEPPA